MLMLAPIVAVVFGALAEGEGGLSAEATLDYVVQTFLYASATMLFSLALALPAAWLTTMRRFRGDRLVVWALCMPLALPPYITGYAYADFLESVFWIHPRGTMAAAAATSLAVYPYIYLFARAALREQSCHIQSAARLMGYSPLSACIKISWPLARPAVIAGAALALMETLNDFALAEHYGVRVLGLGIIDLWLNRGDLHSACRLSVLLLAAVLALLFFEERGRRRQRLYASQCDRCFACDRAAALSGASGWLCKLFLLLPPLAGFFLPVLWFVKLTFNAPPDLWRTPFWEGLGGSLILSVSAAAILLSAAVIFSADKRGNGRGPLSAPLARAAHCGYALPGAVLAQGFCVLAAFLGGAFLFAGLGLLLAACATRFFMIAGNAMESGMSKISPQLDAAARLANVSPLQTWRRVHLPLLRPMILAALFLVFLETVKELPMTLILRPFNFQTLATTIYQYASDESLELAAPSVLAAAAVGAIAVSLLLAMEGKNWRRQ